MDPSRCANPSVFKLPAPHRDAREDLEVVGGDGLERRLQHAAQLAAAEHKSRDSQPLLPIVIENESHTTIMVSQKIEGNGLEYLIISRGSEGPDIRIPNDRFQHLHFINLVECRVFVMTKLVRVYFYDCKNCQVSIRAPLIGSLEYYKCQNINLNTRVPENPEDPHACIIPLTKIEHCDTVHIFQSNSELMYVVKLSTNIKGTIINAATGERIAEYPVGGKLFWDEQEQTIICLSVSSGFASVPLRYALNDIQHHMMVQPLEESVEMDDGEDDLPSIFGTTPPSRNSMIPALFPRGWK